MEGGELFRDPVVSRETLAQAIRFDRVAVFPGWTRWLPIRYVGDVGDLVAMPEGVVQYFALKDRGRLTLEAQVTATAAARATAAWKVTTYPALEATLGDSRKMILFYGIVRYSREWAQFADELAGVGEAVHLGSKLASTAGQGLEGLASLGEISKTAQLAVYAMNAARNRGARERARRAADWWQEYLSSGSPAGKRVSLGRS